MDKNKTTRPFAIQILSNAIPQVKNFDPKYAYIPFRLLSSDSIIGAGGWNCSFFPKKVLQEAAQLWEGQVLRVDHSLSTKNIIGNVVDVWFDEGFIQNGVAIPAGVNGFFKVSREEFSKEVELLTSEPSGIRATSAGVAFDFEPSHEFEDEWDFWWHVGETINGEYVHFNVTKITEVIEQSAVWDGADPCAVMLSADEDGVIFKYLKENKVLNAERLKALKTKTENSAAFKSELKKEFPKGMARFAKLTFTNPADTLDDTFGKGLGKIFKEGEEELKKLIVKNKEENNLDFKNEKGETVTELEAIADVSQEELKKKDSRILQLQVFLEEEKQTVLKLQKLLSDAQQTVKENLAFATLGTQLLEKKRAYTKEVYAKQGKELSEGIEKMIMNADFNALDDLIEMFAGEAMTFYGVPKCEKCGSKEFTVRNSQHTDLPDERQGKATSSNDALENFYLNDFLTSY